MTGSGDPVARARNRFRIVHTECSLGWGGQEMRILSEMQAMRSRGHEMRLVAPANAAICSECRKTGLHVHLISDRKLSFPFDLVRLAQWFRRNKVEVVNTHSSWDGWVGGVAARMARVALLIRSRHIEVDYPRRFGSRLAYHHLPDHVITTSRRISGRLISELGLSPARVTTIPTGVDFYRFDATLRGRIHEELGISQDVRLVGMISVLRSWKGHPYFLEAARQLAARVKKVHFVIAGDGPCRDSVLESIRTLGLSDQVRWLGHRSDVPNLLASLAVLVLPSTAHEGVPQIVLQAQAMGVAVVGTDVGGIPEVVQDQKTGLLVPPRDGTQLAEKILCLLSDPVLRRRLALAGQEQTRRGHGLDAMCEHLEALYRNYL